MELLYSFSEIFWIMYRIILSILAFNFSVHKLLDFQWGWFQLGSEGTNSWCHICRYLWHLHKYTEKGSCEFNIKEFIAERKFLILIMMCMCTLQLTLVLLCYMITVYVYFMVHTCAALLYDSCVCVVYSSHLCCSAIW